ncbi:family 20 glycosylhydrolase [Mucilaginibacter daejeonensis]|uniref:family 20 glycosylhydrolase n=1 Tax=Mucilaginibacter daejeonensis TaxID=398049 RepID=UPI001D1745E6|nr:family 20 glycosylhydrolase [Mucilaginibacter daejeonensis]UEG52538.1 family 20 glycosylhydrolase [Mucilaginibacter daejeonensis]
MSYKTCLSFCISLILLTGAANAQTQTPAPADPYMGIIPAPVTVQKQAGNFVLSQETTIMADTVSDRSVQFLSSYLQSKFVLKNKVLPNKGSAASNVIVFTSAGTEGLPAEGYRLTISPQRITIAAKGAGLFYGVQTLIQLLPIERAATAKIPCARIEDMPRFGYRGMHLDVCRHFFSIEFVKRYIDLMAAYKLNKFHWHLTDDQGWRIEIKKYPKLTSVGSQRAQTLIGNYHDRMPQQFDGMPYGGFYTQEQARDIVRYAAERYITVIPEIEMPGHAMAALAAYPELSCDPGQPYKVAETWGVFNNIFCPTEQTFGFLQDVLSEIIDIFPSKYIHIGGDEAPKVIWKSSPQVQQMIKKLKLKDEHAMQSYFIQRMEKFVNSKGRSIIGWDEILEGGLAPNATVMSWRGEAGGIAAAKQNHDVVMTPSSSGLYFDHSQARSDLEPLSIGGYTPLSKTYAYNPLTPALTPDQQRHILGVQANLWTEYITTETKAEYMLLPRLMALSEVAWSPLANKNYTDMAEVRLPRHLAWLDANRFDYRVPTAIGAKDTSYTSAQLVVNLKVPVTGAKIYYSIDGYTPNETNEEYTYPFTLNIPPDEYRELKTIVITPTGKRSLVTHTTVYNRTPLPPVPFTGKRPGVKYELVAGLFTSTGQLDGARVLDTGVVKTFNTAAFKKANRTFGVTYEGYFNVDADGKYIFSTQSDDGSVIFIDDQLVVDNDGKHSLYEQPGEVLLQKGMHKFTLKYFEAGAFSTLRVYMTMPGKPKGEFSAEALVN